MLALPALLPRASVAPAPPHQRAGLLTPRFYTKELTTAARPILDAQQPAFKAMLTAMEVDDPPTWPQASVL